MTTIRRFYSRRWLRRLDASFAGLLLGIAIYASGLGILPVVDPPHFVGVIAGGPVALTCGHAEIDGWICNFDGVLER